MNDRPNPDAHTVTWKTASRCPRCDIAQAGTIADGQPHPLHWVCQSRVCAHVWPFDGVIDVVGRERIAVSANPKPPSGGDKLDQGKPRMDLLDPYAIDQLAHVLTFGAQKYAAHNWRKGLPKGRLIAAALRHLFSYLSGQDLDPESGLPHPAHAMCCCMFLLGLDHRLDLDDRHKEAAP